MTLVGLVILANAAGAVLNQPAHGPLFTLLPVAGITLLLAAIIFPNRQPLLFKGNDFSRTDLPAACVQPRRLSIVSTGARHRVPHPGPQLPLDDTDRPINLEVQR